MKRLKRLFSLLTPNLKNKILYHLILVAFLPMLVIFISAYAYIKNSIHKEFGYQMNRELTKCIDLINREFSLVISNSNNILTNNYLIYNLQQDYENDLESIMDFYNNLDVLLSSYTQASSTSNTFTLYTLNPSLYESYFIRQIDRIKDDPFVKIAVLNSSENIAWNPTPEQNGLEQSLVFYRNIVLFNERQGVLKVQIPLRDILFVMNQLDIPQGGEVLYKTDTLLFSLATGQPVTSSDESKMYSVSGSLLNDHEIVVRVPGKLLMSRYHVHLLSILLIALLFLVIIIYVSNGISTRITRGLTDFINHLKRNDELMMDHTLIQIEENDEIGIIKRKYRDILMRTNQIYQDIMAVKSQKNALEIELLQTRLNPHLLYNSLSMLRWKAVKCGDKKTCEMIDLMTNYYRSVLNKGRNIVTLHQELSEISDYVRINEMARDANYNLSIVADPKIYDCYTLQLLLQPFVENAIIHGLNGKEGESRISITGRIDHGDIILEVEDNGYGIDPETLTRIVDTKNSTALKGYGIRNTIHRIHLYFGEKYGVTITSTLGVGTCARIEIPSLNLEEMEKKAAL